MYFYYCCEKFNSFFELIKMFALQKNIMPLESFHFRHPFTLMLAGPTQSGETTIIQKIIGQAWEGLVLAPPAAIIYCYHQWQEIYDEIKIGRPKALPISMCRQLFSTKGCLISKILTPIEIHWLFWTI
jgi:hypothetical protein